MRLAAVLAVVLVPCAALAQAPLTIKGLRHDATRDQVLALIPDMDCNDKICMLSVAKKCGNYNVVPEDQRLACIAQYGYAGITPNTWVATFEGAQLNSLRVLFHEMHFNDIAAALVERFGKPDSTRKDSERTLLWERAGGRMVARADGAKSYVGLFNAQAAAQRKEDERQRNRDIAKDRAKDL